MSEEKYRSSYHVRLELRSILEQIPKWSKMKEWDLPKESHVYSQYQDSIHMSSEIFWEWQQKDVQFLESKISTQMSNREQKKHTVSFDDNISQWSRYEKYSENVWIWHERWIVWIHGDHLKRESSVIDWNSYIQFSIQSTVIFLISIRISIRRIVIRKIWLLIFSEDEYLFIFFLEKKKIHVVIWEVRNNDFYFVLKRVKIMTCNLKILS